MSINGGLKNTLTLVHFQMEAAEITLVSSDVWHKQLLCCPTENQRLQIMWFWGEVMCCFFFFLWFGYLFMFAKRPNTGYFT